MKTIQTFVYPLEAHVVKTYLKSEGINSEIRDEMTVQVNNFYSHAIGGVKLLVKEEERGRGIEVLKKGGFIKESKTNTQPIDLVYTNKGFNKEICPFCQSDNISIKKVPSIWTVLVIFVFVLNAVFPVFFKKTYKCYSCDKEWRLRKA
ncbi:putative signal transducing protein [Geofilum rubicundum]|uniref:DUF2007 domain-containing protein n=1 Tax=Geofilum rubicundum JCM 15548 TaxID=1236989 RepID=A0A0E9M0A3_9BACT|nr:DUF2007 domain-containing protein [Geofilum rubicundum]GAO30811.1 hypothetical protein JCM15548_13125 [Geofilum rubicundum JCM 15548]